MDSLKECWLFQELQKKNGKYGGDVESCWNVAQKILRTVGATHPAYTSHGPDHALAVLNILDLAMQPLDIDLNEEELYILITATLLHDVGMAGDISGSEEARRRIRDAHHIRTKAYIIKEFSVLRIDRTYRKVIAIVAAAHRKLNIEEHIVERKIGSSQHGVPRIKLCAALLRMADECHMAEDRVAEDYGALGLSEDSLKHFQRDFNSVGLSFRQEEGEIAFTVEIKDEKLDRLYKEARRKIQGEIDGLQSVFEQNKIPYVRVVMDEDREELVGRKLRRLLLKEGQCIRQDILGKLKGDGESEEDTNRYLDIHGNVEPFEIDAGEMYGLRCSEDVFDDLATEFLLQTREKTDAMVFVRSKLAQAILTDEYLTKILSKSISLMESKEKLFRVVRNSPSALRYILERRDGLPRKRAAGPSALVDSVKAELENDFLEYPELLLEPGLLDDVFDDGSKSEAWKRLKVCQIAEYHGVFDIKKLVQQWCCPNEWERKAHPQLRQGNVSVSTTFKTRECEGVNPAHLLIAAHRMKLPWKIEQTDDFEIEATFRGVAKEDGTKPVSMIEMKFWEQPKISFPVAVRILREGVGKYVLQAEAEGEGAERDGVAFPLLLWIQEATGPRREGKRFSITMRVNYDVLDCGQASLLLKAAKEKDGRVKLRLFSSECELGEVSKFFGQLYDPGNGETEKVVKKLGRVQDLLGQTIPVPLDLPDVIANTILNTPVRSRADAQGLWTKILEQAVKTKRCYSPIRAVVIRENRSKIKAYLGSMEGIHQPKFKVEGMESDLEDAPRIVDEALNDPRRDLEYTLGHAALSPEAIIEYLMEKGSPSNGQNVPDLNILKEIITESSEECKTRMTFKWLKEEDRVWHTVTPFEVCLEEMTWERWLLEAQYLTRVKKDYRRAYVAYREAFKVRSDSPDVLISYGWAAYGWRRVKEAVDVTKLVLNDEQTYFQFLGNINLGLYHLDMAGRGDDENGTDLDAAKQHYEKAVGILTSLKPQERVTGVDSAIEDILEYKDRLHSDADTYVKMFQEYDQSS